MPLPDATIRQFGKPVARSLPTIIRSFKSAVTRQINEYRLTPGAIVWQRNYYERIIRNQEKLIRIHQYTVDRPLSIVLIDDENTGKRLEETARYPREPAQETLRRNLIGS